MSGSEWERIKKIFHAARPRSGTERERVLDELCGDDEVLKARVIELIAADEERASLLDSRELDGPGVEPPPVGEGPVGSIVEGPGDRIGPYKLLQEIGEGGFGVVYMAEQEEPIRRRVALKVIKPGMDTKQVIARFEAERQALAMMDHPNIAKVFDAGTTPSGRPYFVMELVKGIPITDYCDDGKLDTRERLELFTDVCRAVEHAHEAGIIHRDLKPTNVLVTLHDGTPVPKVIDFGVAKATRSRLTESTLFTEFHQFIGTPTYMSPEQAAYEGLEVDTRSDVYSLGVLLYELLTGTTPFEETDMKRAAYFEVLRILKEEEPPKPSTRVSTMGGSSELHARHRGADPSALAKLLRGDLDWIVMKALEKDRRRRYSSASEMADDVMRYFEQKPIHARPPSRLYRAQKLLNRRRGRFAAAAVLLLALGIDVGYVTWQRAQMATVTAAPADLAGARSELLITSENQECFFQARPSPDGAKVAYVNICDEPGLYLYDVRTDETEPLRSDGSFYWGIAWSPDGSSIAAGTQGPFEPEGRPLIIDAESGEERTPPALADIPFVSVRWSPDGDHLAGTRRRDDERVSSVVVGLDTGDMTILAENVPEGQGSPAFSPDGRYVVFADVTADTEDLFVVDLESGDRWPLTTRPEAESAPLWSPDGSHVVFKDPIGLWALPVSEGRADGEPRLVRRGQHWPAAWTEEGYYYEASTKLTRGYRIPMDPQTGRATGDEWESLPLPASALTNMRFAWAPDMRRMAAAGWGDEMVHLIEDGRITPFPIGLEMAPSKLWWSDDGSEIYFTDRTLHAVHALDTDDGTVRPLFKPTDRFHKVDVSPDGRFLVAYRPQGGHESGRLVLSDLRRAEGVIDSVAGVALAIGRAHGEGGFHGRSGQPLLSPDGTHVLFLRRVSFTVPSRTSLWVVRTDGTGEQKLDERRRISRPQWDPTGRMIAFQTWDEGESGLNVVAVEDGSVHEIRGFSNLQEGALLDWSPDGRWLAVAETVGRRELWRDRDLLGRGGK